MAKRSHTFTFSGIACAALAAGLGAFAYFTGNALAATLAFALLFGIFVHLTVSSLSIQSLEIHLQAKANRIRSMEPFPFEVRLRNRSRWLPIHCPSILLEESGRHREQLISFRKTIAPGDEWKTLIYPRFTRRGLQKIRIYNCRSSFPFQLTTLNREILIESERVRVWPASQPVSARALMAMARQSRRECELSQGGRQENFDPNQFRSYRAGDPKRQINWKLSAKAGGLMVNDHEEARQALLTFALFTHPSHWSRPLDFEKAIRLLSSLLEESYGQRLLAGVSLNNRRQKIRDRASLEDALDRLSELEQDFQAPPEIKGLQLGDYIVTPGNRGIALKDWKGAIALE